jgi:hypothetical protein
MICLIRELYLFNWSFTHPSKVLQAKNVELNVKFQINPIRATAGAALATLTMALSTPAAWAQNRTCVVDDATWEVVCGRLASSEEINDFYARQNQVGSTPVPTYAPAAPAYRPAPVVVQQPVVVQPAPVYVPPPVVVAPPAPQPGLLEIFAGNQNTRGPEDVRMSDRDARRNVNRLFQEVLGREADYLALQNFSAAVVKGRSLEDVRLELARSEEGREVIRRAYREILKREADPSGLNSFHQKLINGESITQIRNDLTNSEEARRRR